MKSVALAAAVLCASVFATTARAEAQPNLFAGAGVFVDNPGNLPGPWGLAASLEANHFTWIAFHVHPVIGVYRKYTAANYVPLLAGLGTRGFSVFLADQAAAADYAALEPLAAAASG